MRTGLHTNDTRDHAKILDYYRRSGAKTFKTLVYHDDLLAALKGLGVTIVGRVYTDRQELGGRAARDHLNRVLDSARQRPHVDYWEGYNEAFGVPGELGRYAELEIERMRALEAIGKKAVIGNFSQGAPEITDGGRAWAEFRSALEHAAARGHALGLHEYAGPYMQWGVETPDGRNQWNHQKREWSGASEAREMYYNPALEGWHTLRYRKVYRLLRSWGIGDLPLFITEGGIDDTPPRPGGQGAGYKNFAGTEWARMPAVGDYAEQRRWYMWQVSHDRYVKGVVDFGWEGTATGWASFDLAADPAMVNRIIAAEADLPVGHHAARAPAGPPAPPAPPPATVPSPAGGYRLVSRPARARSSRAGERAQWIVVHSTATPVGGTPEGTAGYLAANEAQVSIHELVCPGVVYQMVPDSEAAHHAGYATLPDGTKGAEVNRVSWGIEIFQVAGQPCDGALVVIATERITEACRRLGITDAGRIVGHGEVDRGRRSDPVGVDMDALRAAVAAKLGAVAGGPPAATRPTVEQIKAAAVREHERAGIRINPKAALQRALAADGLWPTVNEVTVDGVPLMRGESPAGGAWVYWWRDGRVLKAKL